jgi:hypothetical protein
MNISQKQVRLIKTAQRALGLSNADYRAMLATFDAASCTSLTDWQADRMIAMLRERGFVPIKASKRTKVEGVIALPTSRQLSLIEVLKANIYWKVSQIRSIINELRTPQPTIEDFLGED